MKTSLCHSARIAGKVAETAAIKVAYTFLPRRQLWIEKQRVEAKLVELVNSSKEYDPIDHLEMIARRRAIIAALQG